MFTVGGDEMNNLLNPDADICMSLNDRKYIVFMLVNGADTEFDIDTGAAVSCVSEATCVSAPLAINSSKQM